MARTKRQAEQRIKTLREKLETHNYRYYVLDDPVVSDAEYDELKDELQTLEQEFPEFITPDSPTQRVGAEPQEELGTREHKTPMLSLQAVQKEEDFRHFYHQCCRELEIDSLELVAEPKYDGASVELIYENGRFQAATTRGDGRTGEDVTANVKTLHEVVLRLQQPEDRPIPRRLTVRGEIYMEKEEFARFNRDQEEQGNQTFANPRNAAAGSLRQLDPAVTARRPLHIFFWEVAASSGQGPDNHWENLAWMRALGLRINPESRLFRALEEAIDWRQKIEKRRDQLAYEIDGCVFKVNSLQDQQRLGTRAANPRWAIAWKFPPRQKVTRIKDIQAQVGRTGALTPVATLEPVHIGGVKITHVSLHNQDEIDRKDIRIGDHVFVERAGDVIPHVVRVVKDKRNGREEKYRLPEHCPVCGGQVIRPQGEAIAHCSNASCPAQLVQRLLHFSCKQALDIQGLGEKLAEQLVAEKRIENLADLFTLSLDDLRSLERMGEKNAQNLLNAIQESKKNVTLPRLLFALGIPHVGRALADELAFEFGDINKLAEADKTRLKQVEAVSDKIASAIEQWFANPENRRLLAKLEEQGITPEQKKRGQRLQGKTLVITGSLDSLSREEAEEAIRRQGGKATSSVSGNTDYLVVGANPGQTKRQDAENHGVETIDEARFLELLGAKT